MIKDPIKHLLRAWLLTAVVDGAFSGALAQFFYGSTAVKLFQGVASTVLGKEAMDGGTQTALIGLLMHFGVALGWSTVLLVLAMQSSWIRQRISTSGGMLAVAAVYGPVIWMVMSLVVIPSLTHRPPNFTYKWWIQVVGHIPFVAVPIVSQIARGVRSE